MTHLFSYEEGSLLLRLIAAHVVADFYLQKSSWIESKVQKNITSPYLWLHTFIAAAGAWLVLWNLNYWWVFVITFVTHLPTDAWKTSATKKVVMNESLSLQTKASKELRLFIIDQVIHFTIIFILWLFIIDGFQRAGLGSRYLFTNYRLLLYISGYLFILQPTGFLIGNITKRWLPELNMKDSLRDAGTWIGLLERTIVLTLIYSNQYSAIGFLIAAKSILRVTDKPEVGINNESTPFSSRKHTEYVLIGTFLSFGIALIVGFVINYLVAIK